MNVIIQGKDKLLSLVMWNELDLNLWNECSGFQATLNVA
jgi:hypothetical protein